MDLGVRLWGFSAKNGPLGPQNPNFFANDLACQFLGQLDHFPETRFNFSVKNWLFFKRKKRHINYKGFPSTAKTLPYVFIDNF